METATKQYSNQTTSEISQNKHTYVFYHKNCMDGFGAAYAFWSYWEDRGYVHDFVEYIPIQYGDAMPELPKFADVYLLDFSLKRPQMVELSKKVRQVTVIDHHATAEKELAGIEEECPSVKAVFNMEKSGAVLTWEYFFPEEDVPRMLLYIQDRDLWKWELPDSREISEYLAYQEKRFGNFKAISERMNSGDSFSFVMTGATLLIAKKKEVDKICCNAKRAKLFGVEVVIVNTASYISEVGERLLEVYPNAKIAVMFFQKLDDNKPVEEDDSTGKNNFCLFGDTVLSLRSRGDVNCAEIAAKFAGGGHPPAAGFSGRSALFIQVKGGSHEQA